ncbi:MAG TPA: hypothetical protein VFU15_08510 [Bacteroidia bacterium]|nr:hypothetical protein [Bacteroidia bacterium]
MEKKKDPVNEPAGKTYNIPADGSLGLLALGIDGLKAWRKKRREQREKSEGKTGRENNG